MRQLSTKANRCCSTNDLNRLVPGTHRLHCFCSISTEELEVRDFSSSEEMRVERVLLARAGTTDEVVNSAAIKVYHGTIRWLMVVGVHHEDNAGLWRS